MTENVEEKSTVLIVDDEEDLRNIFQVFLKPMVDNVLTAGDGMSALEALQKNHVDVMLLDIHMPDIDGLEVLNIIKKKHPEVVTIIVSGHGGRNAEIQALRSHAFAFLNKPVEKAQLIEKVKDALSYKAKNKIRKMKLQAVRNKLF
jgi:DNA-binding NtrC family response regulator